MDEQKDGKLLVFFGELVTGLVVDTDPQKNDDMRLRKSMVAFMDALVSASISNSAFLELPFHYTGEMKNGKNLHKTVRKVLQHTCY